MKTNPNTVKRIIQTLQMAVENTDDIGMMQAAVSSLQNKKLPITVGLNNGEKVFLGDILPLNDAETQTTLDDAIAHIQATVAEMEQEYTPFHGFTVEFAVLFLRKENTTLNTILAIDGQTYTLEQLKKPTEEIAPILQRVIKATSMDERGWVIQTGEKAEIEVRAAEWTHKKFSRALKGVVKTAIASQNDYVIKETMRALLDKDLNIDTRPLRDILAELPLESDGQAIIDDAIRELKYTRARLDKTEKRDSQDMPMMYVKQIGEVSADYWGPGAEKRRPTL